MRKRLNGFYIHLEFGYVVSREERLYLTIHIERIRELHVENESVKI